MCQKKGCVIISNVYNIFLSHEIFCFRTYLLAFSFTKTIFSLRLLSNFLYTPSGPALTRQTRSNPPFLIQLYNWINHKTIFITVHNYSINVTAEITLYINRSQTVQARSTFMIYECKHFKSSYSQKFAQTAAKQIFCSNFSIQNVASEMAEPCFQRRGRFVCLLFLTCQLAWSDLLVVHCDQ